MKQETDAREKALIVIKRLDERYPYNGVCFLRYEKPYELLFATILSAQCTDERVNLVTKTLFVKYPSLAAFASADLSAMEADVRSTGFYHTKAKHLILAAQRLLADFGGQLPSELSQLTSLPGVGRKTANIVRGHIFNIPSVAVDTHVKRVSNKLGLAADDDPERIELALMDILPQDAWIKFNQQIISHGRAVCTAPRPKCGACFLYDICAAQNAAPKSAK